MSHVDVLRHPPSLTRLLASERLSVVTAHPDAEVTRITALLEDPLVSLGRGDLEALLCRLLAAADGAAPAPKSLDLIGHSTSAGLLSIGDWVVDGTSAVTTAFFRELADHDVLPRLGIHTLRLLGCGTAATPRGRDTLRILSSILGVEVLGTTGPIYNVHYEQGGFSPRWRFMLAPASAELDPRSASPITEIAPSPRPFDVDALPLVELARLGSAARHVATLEAARAILELVDRAHGAELVGLMTTASHEIAFPAQRAGHAHLAEVILDGLFLRVFPDGADRPGIVFPVSEPHRLLALVTGLPVVPRPALVA